MAPPVVELSVALVTFGGTQLPLMIDGLLSSGQYKRNIKMNLSAGDGSQLDSLSTPGNSSGCRDQWTRQDLPSALSSTD